MLSWTEIIFQQVRLKESKFSSEKPTLSLEAQNSSLFGLCIKVFWKKNACLAAGVQTGSARLVFGLSPSCKGSLCEAITDFTEVSFRQPNIQNH